MDKNWPNSVRYNVHRIYFTGVVSCLFYCIWEYVCANVLICAAKKLHYYITYPTKDAGKDIALKLYGPFQHEICIKWCIKSLTRNLNMSQNIYWKIVCYEKLFDLKNIRTHKRRHLVNPGMNL